MSASSGQPSSLATTMLPMYPRSSMPICVVQKPRGGQIAEAAEERACPCGVSRLQARRTARRCRRARSVALRGGAVDERLVEPPLALDDPATRARRASRPAASGWSIIMKSMNSGTPASVALPDRSSLGMIRSDEHAHRRLLVGREELRLERAPVGCARLRGLRQVVRMLRFRLGPGECRGKRRGREHDLQHRPTIDLHHIRVVPVLRSSTMNSLVRMASARIVHVEFLSACETNGPPSATNRFSSRAPGSSR